MAKEETLIGGAVKMFRKIPLHLLNGWCFVRWMKWWEFRRKIT